MALQTIHDTLDEIPEPYRELYSERDEKWVLTGIEGVKTQADIDGVRGSLSKERKLREEIESKYKPWAELDHDEIMSRLDRIPELEAAAEGKLDEGELSTLAEKRAEAMTRTKLAPIERERDRFRTAAHELEAEVKSLRASAQKRELFDVLDPLVGKAGVLPEHIEDVRMYAEMHFERTEESGFLTRDELSGVKPGLDPAAWLTDILDRKPGWRAPSGGGGAGGSKNRGALGGENPWSERHWSVTKQGQYEQEHGRDKAERMAAAAGVSRTATAPKRGT